jgi:DNA ligase-associated metallophosphoesterase
VSRDGALEIELRGERLLLHPERAIEWPARRTLIVADTHFAKDDIFRRAGIALPRGPAVGDLQRLDGLVTATACERLLILGDFVHGATRDGDSFPHAFRVWRECRPELSVNIVAGNHDRREAASKWRDLTSWHEKALVEAPFVFSHEPGASTEGYVLAGHLHPVWRFGRRSGGGRVPVFWRRPEWLVLPSFGGFTGGVNVPREAGDVIYIAAPERVMALP